MLSWMTGAAPGLFLPGWLPQLPSGGMLLAGLAAGLGLSGWLLRGAPRRFAIGLLLGMAYGMAWGHGLLAERLPAALEGEVLRVEGVIGEPPQLRRFSDGGQRQRFVFHVDAAACAKACPPLPMKALLSYYGDAPLAAAQRWRFQARLKRPWGLANPGSFNFQSYLARHRIAATGYVRDKGMERLPDMRDEGAAARDERAAARERGMARVSGMPPWRLLHQRWRQRIGDSLQGGSLQVGDGLRAGGSSRAGDGARQPEISQQSPADARVRGLLLALSNGDRSGIGHHDWQRVQAYGLNHLLVISGLHVGMAGALGYLLGSLRGRRTAHVLAAALACLYAAQAGFALPTVRALVMQASVQCLALAHRRPAQWRCLLLALFCIALLEPLATHSAGFWLSFGAVAVIFHIMQQHPGLGRWALLGAMQLALSLAMGLAGGLWFGGASWLAPLANLAAVPAVSFWVAPLCMLASGLSLLSAKAAQFIWELAAYPLRGFLHADAWLEGRGIVPWLQFKPDWLAVCAGAAGLYLILLHRAAPGRYLGAAFLLLACLPRILAPPPGELRFAVLDVGQGLAAVLQTRSAAVVYDTGAGDPAGPNMATSVIIPYLEREGIDALDLLVVSHGDQDHAGGALSLQRRLPVREVWYGERPVAMPEDERGGAFAETAGEGEPGFAPAAQQTTQRACAAGYEATIGDVHLQVLHPPLDAHRGAGRAARVHRNELSCVLLARHGDTRILLPGDIGADTERALVRRWGDGLRADVLLAPHHGSKTSSSTAFLRRVRPGLAINSRGHVNRFGHPHPRVAARYRGLGIAVLDTAPDGAILLRRRADGPLEARAWRRERAFYWH